MSERVKHYNQTVNWHKCLCVLNGSTCEPQTACVCVCVCVYIVIQPSTTALAVLSASVLFSLTPESGYDDRQREKGRMKIKREKWDVKTLKEADVHANIIQQPLLFSYPVLLCPFLCFPFLSPLISSPTLYFPLQTTFLFSTSCLSIPNICFISLYYNCKTKPTQPKLCCPKPNKPL